MKKKTILRTVLLSFSTLIISCASLNENLCKDYSSVPVSTLEEVLIDTMIQGYKNNQLKHINAGMDFKDSESIWFDLETLKAFIYHIETNNKIKEMSSSADSILGIRIHYAKYPKRISWKNDFKRDLGGFSYDPEQKLYEDRHTVIMIPSIRSNGSITDIRISPKKINTKPQDTVGNPRIDPSQNPFPKGSYRIISLTISKDIQDRSARNHGSLIPPGISKEAITIRNQDE